MSSFRAAKVLCFIVLTVGIVAAQKAASSITPKADSQLETRPRIFQKSAVLKTSATSPSAHLSGTDSRLASDQELEEMERTLEGYVTAFENLSLAGLRQVWPDLDRRRATALKDVFAGLKGGSPTRRVDLQCSTPQLTTDSADVQCIETVTYRLGKEKDNRELGPVGVSIQMKSQSGHWIISDMKGSS